MLSSHVVPSLKTHSNCTYPVKIYFNSTQMKSFHLLQYSPIVDVHSCKLFHGEYNYVPVSYTKSPSLKVGKFFIRYSILLKENHHEASQSRGSPANQSLEEAITLSQDSTLHSRLYREHSVGQVDFSHITDLPC